MGNHLYVYGIEYDLILVGERLMFLLYLLKSEILSFYAVSSYFRNLKNYVYPVARKCVLLYSIERG